MAACFCLPLCDQNGPLVIRTWIPSLGRTGFLLSTLTSENFMPTTLGIGVQWPAMGLERRWWLLKTYKLKLTRHKCNLVLPRWLSSKQSPCQCRRPSFDLWVEKIPWRRKWQPTPVFLPEKSHRQWSLVGYSPWGHKELDGT